MPKINLPTVESILASSLLCTTDSDSDGQISSSCANYPMINTTYEGDLDVNDANSSIKVDMSCLYSGDKNQCESNLIVDGCGSETVLDIGTGLCWDRNFNRNGTAIIWADTINYCNDLKNHPSGHTDWYLPSRQELFTLIDLSIYNPAIIGGNTKFTNVRNDFYWTASTYLSSSEEVWYVYLYRGYVGATVKYSSKYLVCARRD